MEILIIRFFEIFRRQSEYVGSVFLLTTEEVFLLFSVYIWFYQNLNINFSVFSPNLLPFPFFWRYNWICFNIFSNQNMNFFRIIPLSITQYFGFLTIRLPYQSIYMFDLVTHFLLISHLISTYLSMSTIVFEEL